MAKRLGIFIVVVLLAGLVFAQDAISLARKPKAGQSISYVIKADISISGTTATYTATSTEKVVDVADDGSYTVESRQSDLRVRYDNRDIAPDPLGATRTKYSADGEVLEIISDMDRTVAFRVAAMTNIQYPAKTLKLGDKWEIVVKPSSNNNNVGGKADYSFDKFDEVDGMKAAVVKFTFTEDQGPSPAHSDGTAWINTADGSLIKTEVNLKNAPFPGAPGPIDAKMTVTRLPEK